MPILKPLLAATLLAVPVSPAIPQTADLNPVPRVICREANGYSAGTAFRVGNGLLLSVKHVTSNPRCEIEGRPIRILYQSSKADFTMLSDDRKGPFLEVDCEGFKQGHRYVAIGHARALEEITMVPLVGTGVMAGPFAILVGVFTVQPGQSGGPIVDAETGKVVGLVNAADWSKGISFSVELKSTSLCGGNIA